MKKQFCYVLKLIERLRDENNWTEKENDIVNRHFKVLQNLQKEGELIMAGRTLNESDPEAFGIVILEVDSKEEAEKLMNNDPAVEEGIMTATLFPFGIALMNNDIK